MRMFDQKVGELGSQPGALRTFDAEQVRTEMEALTPLRCGICRYPVMAVWKYCPGCGVQLIWEGMQNIKK